MTLSRPAHVDPAVVLTLWPATGSPAARVAALAHAVWGEAAAGDSPGRRNQRALTLHQVLVGAPMEARVVCPDCDAENAVTIPLEAVLAAPSPELGQEVEVETSAGRLSFGLPKAGDPRAADPSALVQSLCRDPVTGAFDERDLEAIGAAWEAADPAGAIELALSCVACCKRVLALADPLAFVARDLDRSRDHLLREIDLIARNYGWSEAEILALPGERRRRYVAMIQAAGPQRPALVHRRA